MLASSAGSYHALGMGEPHACPAVPAGDRSPAPQGLLCPIPCSLLCIVLLQDTAVLWDIGMVFCPWRCQR